MLRTPTTRHQPESCASILYRDAAQAEDAASCLKLTRRSAERGLVDEVVPEPLEGAHADRAGHRGGRRAVFRSLGELEGMIAICSSSAATGLRAWAVYSKTTNSARASFGICSA